MEGREAEGLEAGRLQGELAALQAEVDRLHRKLEDFHVSDYNALRRAYTSLSQHVEALEQEARGMAEELGRFETQPVPPQLVAQELGVASVVTFGVALLHTTVRALPLSKSTTSMAAKGLWLVGGLVVLARLTGGTLAHLGGMFGRNAARKRRLARKLRAVEERIQIMAALQHWAEKQAGPSADAVATPEEAAAATEGGEEEEAWAVPPPRVSPAASAGSSAESGEMVEMPEVQELEAAEAGAAAGEAAGEASGRASRGSSRGGGNTGRTGLTGLQALMGYAELGSKKK